MAISDDELGDLLRRLMRADAGFHVGFSFLLEVGQLEDFQCWVESRRADGSKDFDADGLSVDEAVGHFLRIRRERGLGYDIEGDSA